MTVSHDPRSGDGGVGTPALTSTVGVAVPAARSAPATEQSGAPRRDPHRLGPPRSEPHRYELLRSGFPGGGPVPPRTAPDRGPDQDAPRMPVADGEETLHQSDQTLVTRSRSAGVVRKLVHGPGWVRRHRHELTVLRRLRGVPGVTQLAGTDPGTHADTAAGVIELQDVDGVPLAQLPAPWRIADLLDLALDLTRVLGAVHRRGVVHTDINPTNVLLSRRSGQPVLIDFDTATAFGEPGGPPPTHAGEPDLPSPDRPAGDPLPGDEVPGDLIAGDLAYLAPEQTGRTGRVIDHRTDLYGLGATLYEVATGTPPFGHGDPLRLVHDQLAQVPTPPARRNPAVPRPLSAIIMRLLAKEPDQRYQSAEGLLHDLARLRAEQADGRSVPFLLGERDFPLRLAPPSRPVGREGEIAALTAAFDAALAGRRGGLLVSGAPGIGKTTLIDQLRPLVTSRGGWFVTGKFDQHHHDQDSDATRQALRALGRLLLAEPEERLAGLRADLREALGRDAGLVAAVLPEFGPLLDVTPETTPGDPRTAQSRLHQVGLALLRAVATPDQPVVLVIDDLHWATAAPLEFLDAVLVDEHPPGLLLVGAYRDTEVDLTHPLAALRTRWRRLGVAPAEIHLDTLPRPDLGTLLAELLRLAPTDAADLADAILPHTGGNPYDSVELVNALRRDGVLTPGHTGWSWDPEAVRRYLGTGTVTDLIAARVEALPDPTQALVDVMACLGGEVPLAVLRVAAGVPAAALEQRLAPAVEYGLLVRVPGTGGPAEASVRFGHDRVQQVAFDRLPADTRPGRHLLLARRLAAEPGLENHAAEQYLSAVDVIDDPDERLRVAALFRVAAREARLLRDNVLVSRFVAAATELVDPNDTTTLVELATEWHSALYALGRLEEADEIYYSIKQYRAAPLEWVEATCVQISSLTNRGRPRDAVALGAALLDALGLPVPRGDALPAEIDRGLDELYQWVAETTTAADLDRPEVTDIRVRALGALISRLTAPSFFSEQAVMAWLVTQARRLWAEHGPMPALTGPLSHAVFATSALRDDYRIGTEAVRRALAVGEARGYEPDTSEARFMFALGSAQWFGPLEECVAQAHRAREGMLRSGDRQNACFTYYVSVPDLLEIAPTLEEYLVEVEECLAFAARTANDQIAAAMIGYRQLVRALRGQTHTPGGLTDASFDEAAHLASLEANPTAAGNLHIVHALVAALLDQPASLAEHTAAAMPLLPFLQATYPNAPARVLRAVSLADQLRSAPTGRRADLLAELDTCRDWLAARAADAPGNLSHLLRLVEAERAWATGDFRAATVGFDAAQREATGRRRPWHRAFIAERAARFHLEHGLEYTGATLLVQAHRGYRDWGASIKVRQLEHRYPFLRAAAPRALPAATVDRAPTDPTDAPAPPRAPARGTPLTTDHLDLLAILDASRALSSETHVDRLRTRVVDVLRAMTGATTVQMLLWDEETRTWVLPTTEENGQALTLQEAGSRALVPLSAFRYVERTREPLVVDDATVDDRFARDPYLAGLDRCSLLLVPVISRGALNAVLLLENRLTRGAFTADRLDPVTLIAGQLAISLDNALLYASLERKVAQRTEELAVANARLERLSVTDPLTGLANRRQLASRLEATWSHAVDANTPLGLAMIDVDHFKLYNDHYGHLAGDECLRRVATVVAHQVSDGDLVARFGGEEFAVVLPGADVTVASRVAERIHAAVTALGEPHALSPIHQVTVSIGVVAAFPSERTTAARLLEAADTTLYEAKRRGRNRVLASRLG